MFVITTKDLHYSFPLSSIMKSLNINFYCQFAAIGRTLIPRYFRSIFEGGVTDLYYILKHAKESFHTTSITLDCDIATMVTHHGKPMFTKVSPILKLGDLNVTEYFTVLEKHKVIVLSNHLSISFCLDLSNNNNYCKSSKV